MSVLQDMTAGILNTKATKAAKLTPVQGETTTTVAELAARIGGIPEVPEVFLTNEAVTDIAKDIRRMIGLLGEVADGLDKLTTTETVKPPDMKAAAAEAKARIEAAADARAAAQDEKDEPFAERMARLSAEAQAAAFAANDDGEQDTVGEPSEGNPNTPNVTEDWSCPEHGRTSIMRTKSRKGREYDMCTVTGCDLFEK